jgi:co-chaperonin GroES (HSP10)
MRIAPLHDLCLIRPITANRTAGGIHIPDAVEGGLYTTVRGRVIEAGPGMQITPDPGQTDKRWPMSVAKGQIVAYSKAAAKEVDVDGETFHLVRDHEILVIISET